MTEFLKRLPLRNVFRRTHLPKKYVPSRRRIPMTSVFRRDYVTLPGPLDRGNDFRFSLPPDHPEESLPLEHPQQRVPPGHKKVTQRVTLWKGGPPLFVRTAIVKDKTKLLDPSTLLQTLVGGMARQDMSTMTEEELAKYELTRRTWLDLIEDAPDGTIAQALDMIGQNLYERVGELGGQGIGKTFKDNKTLFYSEVTLDNVCQWAKYETVQIGSASYTSRATRLAGMSISEAGRAWLIWLCHCARTGSTKVDEKVLRMNTRYSWDDMGDLERIGIRVVAKLNPEVRAVVPPDPVRAPELDEL